MLRKRVLAFVIVGCLLVSVLGACGTPAHSVSGPAVHMSSNSFVQAEITIHKGQSVTLIDDDSFTPHIIANGTWKNGAARPENEPNAPKVNDVQINGGAQTAIGPFTTTGTFQFYCTIHEGMNLTITVQ